MPDHAPIGPPAHRPLGRTGLSIAPLVFGGNVFGWTADRERSFALLDSFVEAGFNAIDTADVYSVWVPGHRGGESESIIGAWLKARGRRDRVVIASKVGWEMAPDRKGLRAPYIVRAMEESLARLNTDYIDLYQTHRPDPETPIEETLGAMRTLIDQGKVRAIGASNVDAVQLSGALDAANTAGLPAYATLQPRYNLYDRAGFEGGLQALCVERGVAAIPFSSLAAGFLSGKYRSEADLAGRARGPAVKQYLNARGQRILDALDTVGARLGATAAEVALAWLVAQPGVTAPIASATTTDQLAVLLRGCSLALDAASLAQLDNASAAG